MKIFNFKLEGTKEGIVQAYLQTMGELEEFEVRNLPAIVICPGGGYEWISEREAEPVAKEFFAAGYHVFVLRYSVGENISKFTPLCQLAETMAVIRNNSELWRVDNNKIVVCGFSAGGHLAASLGTLHNKEEFLSVWNRNDDIRPNAMILGYPVITSDEYAHEGSIKNISGAEIGTKEYVWFGLNNHVDAATPPAFIWHTAADLSVPVENSILFALALSASNIPFELHVFPNGAHGMSVCTEEVGTNDVYNGRWIRWSLEWLNKLFDFKK